MGQVFKKHNNADHRAKLCTAIDHLAVRSKVHVVVSLVEILLDFIRAERDGNWILHPGAFTAMLPWLTIYDHTNYPRRRPVYLANMKLLEKKNSTRSPCSFLMETL